MGISPSLERAASGSTDAEKEVDKLRRAIEQNAGQDKDKFEVMITNSLSAAKITDAVTISENFSIKTEYTSAIGIDKIAAVIIGALEVAILAQKPGTPNPATSPEALSAYSGLVASVAEAAKSTSNASASLAYSMNRLAPGMYAFLYATSFVLKDEALFGTESVTSTGIFYKFIQSIDDIKNTAKFGEAVIDAESLLHWKTLQARLITRVELGEITFAEWAILDGQYAGAIEAAQNRLYGTTPDPKEVLGLGAISNTDRDAMAAAIKALALKGGKLGAVAQISKSRLQANYY